jgi:hypothetical protein
MTSNDPRPADCSGYTPFEEELVNAMRDFANKTNAPEFAPATIMRTARRRRSLVTAGIVAVVILAGGGTALAATHGSPTSSTPVHPAGTPVHPAGTPVHPAGTPVHPAGTPVHAATSTPTAHA